MEMVVAIVVPIAAAVGLGFFFNWRTKRDLLAIFWLVTSLPGGDAAYRGYEDIKNSKQVRGLPRLTDDGKWTIDWKIPPYKKKPPKL